MRGMGSHAWRGPRNQRSRPSLRELLLPTGPPPIVVTPAIFTTTFLIGGCRELASGRWVGVPLVLVGLVFPVWLVTYLRRPVRHLHRDVDDVSLGAG